MVDGMLSTGLYHYRTTRPIHDSVSPDSERINNYTGMYFYYKGENIHELTDRLKGVFGQEHIVAVGVATLKNITGNTKTLDPGYTNLFNYALKYKLGIGYIVLKQSTSLMTGNQDNYPTLYGGATSLSYEGKSISNDGKRYLKFNSAFQLLYGDMTPAVHSSLDFGVKVDPEFFINGEMLVGYTGKSKDLFYTPGFHAEGSLNLNMNIFKSKSVTVDMVFNMKATTGQRPYQFGRDENGLQGEAQPIPGEQTVPGVEGGLMFKGTFGGP